MFLYNPSAILLLLEHREVQGTWAEVVQRQIVKSVCLNTHSCCIQFFFNIPLIYNQDTFPFLSSLHLPKDKCSNDPLLDDGCLLCQFYKTTQSNHWQQIDFIPNTNPNWLVMPAGGGGMDGQGF